MERHGGTVTMGFPLPLPLALALPRGFILHRPLMAAPPFLLLLLFRYAAGWSVAAFELRRTISLTTSWDYYTYNSQALDHSKWLPMASATFKQRYAIDATHWGGPDYPILVYTGGEGAMEDQLAAMGFHLHAAPALRALVAFIEHRHYGSSVPSGPPGAADSDATTLGYLSASQALADYAEIVLHIKKRYKARGPVIAIGCSYGGMLSAYFRLKYPHVVHGALASSAPVLFVDGGLSCPSDYYNIVSKDFWITSQRCFWTIKTSWAEIDRINSAFGDAELIRIFNPCDTTLFDAAILKGYLIRKYSEYAQNGSPDGRPVRRFCDAVDGAPPSTPVLQRIKGGLVAMDGNTCCNISRPLKISQVGPGLNEWPWQSWTERNFPIGLDGNNGSMFEPYQLFDLDAGNHYSKTDDGVKPRPEWMASANKLQNITHALKSYGSNFIFSNGRRDPYSAGGVLQNISQSIIALTSDNGTHCSDVILPSATDPWWLRDQRNHEVRIMEWWIGQFSPSFYSRDDQ